MYWTMRSNSVQAAAGYTGLPWLSSRIALLVARTDRKTMLSAALVTVHWNNEYTPNSVYHAVHIPSCTSQGDGM